MMVALVPMTSARFSTFIEETLRDYAADNVRAGRWTESEALTEARKELDRLLPQGIATPNHFLYDIHPTDSDPKVGVAWLAIEPRGGFIYDIRIDEASRRKGHAEATMRALEEVARSHGAAKMALHVFGENAAARHLYRKLGYAETNVMMAKPL